MLPVNEMKKLLLKPTVLGLVVILLAGFLLFFDLGKGSLWDWDEAIYASVAKEMIRDGDYLSLHLNGNYWPEKPPLLIWCMALAYKMFGINEFSARLPAAIFGWLNVILIYLIGKRFFHHWIGLLAALLLASNLHFLIVSRMAMLDIPMMFFTSAALYLFWLGRKEPWYFIFAGIAIGLSVMTKGVIGFFPLPIICLYILLSSQFSLLKHPVFWVMIIISLLVAGPWHIHQVLTHGKTFTDYYFIYNLFTRASSTIEGHTGTIFFYLKYVFEHFFTPWLCLSLLVLPLSGYKLVRNFKKDKSSSIYFLLIWFLVPFLFFSLAKSKVAGYIIPCYLPLALITAKLSPDNLQHLWFKRFFIAVLVVTAAEMALFHPLHMIIIDKSPEVKQIAESFKTIKPKIIAFNIPPNAPSFYFNSQVRHMGDLAQLDNLLLQTKNFYILCKSRDSQSIRAHLEGKCNLKVMATSPTGDLRLIEIKLMDSNG